MQQPYASYSKHRILQLTQDDIFLYRPNPSLLLMSLNLFQHRSTSYANQLLQHRILQSTKKISSSIIPILRHHSAFFDTVKLLAAQVQHRILQLTKKISSSIVPILCHHPAFSDAIQTLAAQVQHCVFQLTQEDIFLCLGVSLSRLSFAATQPLSTPFDSLLLEFSIVFSN